MGDNYTYYNSIYSDYTGKYSDNVTQRDDTSESSEETEQDKIAEYAKRMEDKYLFMDLDDDNDYYGIEVNTSYSSVHVPNYVFDGGMVLINFIT